MARTFPSAVPATSESVAHVCPIDAYTSALTRALVYVEAEGTTDNVTAVYCKSTLTSGANEWGVAGYFETHIAGTTSGHTYGFGSWINVDTSAVLSAGHIIVPFEGGVYCAEAQATARIVLMQLQGILGGAPASMHIFRVNTNQEITAMFAAANAGSVHYAAGETAGTAAGTIAFADIVGSGVRYIQLYSASS